MSKTIVTRQYELFKSKVRDYAQAVDAERYTCHNDKDLFVATVYGLHKTVLVKRPGEKVVNAKIYLGDRNVKTVSFEM